MPHEAPGQTSNDGQAVDTYMKLLDQSSLPFKARLADRLAVLTSAFAEDYDRGTLSPRAIDALVTFLASSASFGYPELTATPAGDLYAEWRGSDGRILTIEFLDSGDVHYLFFGPNPKHPQRTDRLTGFTTADALPDTVVRLAHLSGLAA